MSIQLTLGISLRDDATFSNFYIGANRQVLRCLNELVKGGGESIIYLWGAQEVGITHLLQACCHAGRQRQRSAIFLPLSHVSLTPEVFQDLETVDIICIDDLDSVLSKPEWEESLLHLYNRVREKGSRLVIGSKTMPYLSHCQLQDLKSRLTWGLTLRVDALSEAEKFETLQMRIAQRGLIVSRQTAWFIFRHYSCNMKRLFEMVDRLDQAALIAKRKLTIPFIKRALSCF